MKTKFIKGTNKKYSIREDGVVFGYKGVMTPQKRCDNSILVIIKINGKRTSLSVRRLLLEYFNIFNCYRCNEKYKRNQLAKGFICKNCLLKSKKQDIKRFIEKHPDIQRKYHEKYRKNLKEFYILNLLHMKSSDNIPKEIIELKRNQLKLHRELKKQKQNDTN